MTDYSGSALRYGLVDIRPVEVVETVKKCGMKFRRVFRRFESLEPSKSFEDLVYSQNTGIFGAIDIPEWFDAEKLVEVFSQHSIKSYENDTEFKKAIEEAKNAERKGRPLTSFIQFARNRFESRRDYYLEIEADRFLRSNFPLSFYNKLVVFDNRYYDFLRILEKIVRQYEFHASCARGFPRYNMYISRMRNEVSPILDQMDSCYLSHTCLKKYVLVWNSKEYEEVLNPEFLDIKNCDSSEFQKIFDNYNSKLRESEEFLLRYNPELLHKELDSKESTTNMFGKLVMIPSSSMNLEG